MSQAFGIPSCFWPWREFTPGVLPTRPPEACGSRRPLSARAGGSGRPGPAGRGRRPGPPVLALPPETGLAPPPPRPEPSVHGGGFRPAHPGPDRRRKRGRRGRAGAARWRLCGRWRREAGRAPWPPPPASISRTRPSTCGTSSSWTGREVRHRDRGGAGGLAAAQGPVPGRGCGTLLSRGLSLRRPRSGAGPVSLGAPVASPSAGSGARGGRLGPALGPAGREVCAGPGQESSREDPR